MSRSKGRIQTTLVMSVSISMVNSVFLKVSTYSGDFETSIDQDRNVIRN